MEECARAKLSKQFELFDKSMKNLDEVPVESGKRQIIFA